MNAWKLLRTGLCLASAAIVLGLFVAALWAVASVVIADAAGWP